MKSYWKFGRKERIGMKKRDVEEKSIMSVEERNGCLDGKGGGRLFEVIGYKGTLSDKKGG